MGRSSIKAKRVCVLLRQHEISASEGVAWRMPRMWRDLHL